MDVYDEILRLFDENELIREINLIPLLRLLVRISRYHFKKISKKEYLSYLILILNLSMIHTPDYCHHKGKRVKLLNFPEHKIFIEKLRGEFQT
ncbi:MAG: hypothetical protein ACFFCV_13040 [Promethearchaeota archaeon]